jgi:hypothetical protein
MKELSVKKLENLEGGKFWGRECSTLYYLDDSGEVNCWQYCEFHVFWISVGSEVSLVNC